MPTDPSMGGKIARVSYNGVFQSGKALAGDGDSEEDDWLDLGIDTTEEKAMALENLVTTAVENGIWAEGEKRLRTLCHEYADVFRVRLGPDAPANVEPMKVVLKPSVAPVKSRAKKYPADRRKFMTR